MLPLPETSSNPQIDARYAREMGIVGISVMLTAKQCLRKKQLPSSAESQQSLTLKTIQSHWKVVPKTDNWVTRIFLVFSRGERVERESRTGIG